MLAREKALQELVRIKVDYRSHPNLFLFPLFAVESCNGVCMSRVHILDGFVTHKFDTCFCKYTSHTHNHKQNDPSKASVVPVAESSIQVLSDHCAKPIEQLLLLHGDVVTLRGMPYAEDLTAPLAQVVDRVQTARLRPRLSQAR